MNRLVWAILICILATSWGGNPPARAANRVGMIVDTTLSPPAVYGLETLEEALLQKGLTVQRLSRVAAAEADFLILAQVASSDGAGPRTLRTLNVPLPEEPEGLVIQRAELEGKAALILCGSDARGLMYAALDTADRISWNEKTGNPFSHVRDTCEKPYVRERAVSMYTMQRAYFERRLYDEKHWQKYFGMLARSRINSFVVVFGYENGGFMAPPYPYFFDMPEFPEVKLVGTTTDQQEHNTAAFRRMIEIAHAHGVDVTVAIWDHIYRGGVQGGGIEGASDKAGRPIEGLVWGVTAENLAAYNKAAVRRFLEVFPEIDALQFRMHGESGLKRGEMKDFWHEVFGTIRKMRPDLRVDIRAKELPDAIIDDGLAQGLDLRVTTKYWMEQMGLPFHPTHVNPPNQHDRRHGYADLLRYPQRYKVHWRLWNGGTTRLLLWGDPDYVRRFARSARLYDGDSFEVNEMLATWMLGEPHDAEPLDLLTPAYRYYDYEFERYWHFYQLWGRLGYDLDAPTEVWQRQFERRCGGKAGPAIMEALHLASRVLPRIVAASYRYRLFPTTRGWAEMMRIDDLPRYAGAEGSDVQQFMNMRDQARSVIEGTDTAMRRPAETSRWFRNVADQILEYVGWAEETVAPRNRRGEFTSTTTDLKILAYLARYHSERLRAGVCYNLYKQTGDLFAFDDAVARERRAVEAWQRLVEAADDVYSRNLALGVHRVGFSRHWQEELEKLRSGLRQLEVEHLKAEPRGKGDAPWIAHVPVRRHVPGQTVRLRATVAAGDEVARAQVRYCRDDEPWRSDEMEAVGEWRYQVDVPIAEDTTRIRYFVEAKNGQGEATSLPAGGTGAPIVIRISRDDQPPHVDLERVSVARPGEDLVVTARAWDPSGIKSLRLRYRHVTQYEDYKTEQMQYDSQTGLWSVTIPGEFIVCQWNLMYFVEAVDSQGNGRMYPDLEIEVPYVIVSIDRGPQGPQ
ncbi:MAG: hypothetical protein JW741_11720 [Sedimentisphaerales bacterium]|nr:hypothetical protein [Sedimentisphaerales bacterium]